MSNTNYLKFGPTEIIVAFATDRGELKVNDNGEYFFRALTDRRFTCVSPDLERKLIDMGYRAGDKVGITRGTRNRTVTWKVRVVNAAAITPVVVPTPRPATRAIAAAPSSIPATKYAAPPVAWPETEPAPSKPPTRATALQSATAAGVIPGLDQVSGVMQECMYTAVEVAQKTQARATERGFPLTFSAGDVQDIAVTLYIQLGKQANINLMNRNDDLRRQNGR